MGSTSAEEDGSGTGHQGQGDASKYLLAGGKDAKGYMATDSPQQSLASNSKSDDAPLKDFILKNFLILGLLTVITFGLVCPKPGLYLNDTTLGFLSLPDIAIIVIFVLSGMALQSMSEALVYDALALGMVLVLVVTPALSAPIIFLGKIFPGLNKSMLQGMALFTIVPTTLSSGVTMITQAKGNVSLAILLTSVTNVIGVFTMSLTAPLVFSASVTVSPFEMLNELVMLTLVPLLMGMGLRRVSPLLKDFATKHSKALSLMQNTMILLVVLLMISKAREKIFEASAQDLTLCLSLAAGVHLIYRLLGYASATAVGLRPREWVTIVLMCSQKSLPVCVSVLSALPKEQRKNSGLFILPCVLGHAAQLIIDSMLAVRWQVQAEAATESEAEGKKPLART